MDEKNFLRNFATLEGRIRDISRALVAARDKSSKPEVCQGENSFLVLYCVGMKEERVKYRLRVNVSSNLILRLD